MSHDRYKEDNLAKKRSRELLVSLQRNPDNQFYMQLRDYINRRSEEIRDLMCNETDMDEVKRLQGRAGELKDLLVGLDRKPVVDQYTGAFS